MYTHYERLSALDAVFLSVEDGNTHMHAGAVNLFDAGPLTRADGTIDMERIRRMVQVAIHRVPRYQQRLTTIPLFGSPAWVDDAEFNLNYHVRQLGLPKPGDMRVLKRVTGWIMSQQLDRDRPLWELWVVDGIEGNQVALITKMHHCMIDGVGGVGLTGAFIRATPELEPALDNPPRWLPRRAPSGGDLLLDEFLRRAATPVRALSAASQLLVHPRRTLAAARDAVIGLGEAISVGLHPASPTPLNLEIGPHRRFDWLEMDLAAVKEVKSRFGGTVNDVVLATAAGALSRFLHNRGLVPGELEFRAMIPVNTRTEQQHERMGNRITMIVGRLPLEERDAPRRLQRVIEMTTALKRSGQALGIKTLAEVSDLTAASLFSGFIHLSTSARPYNVVITNIPGPKFQAYFLGSALQAVYPLVPLNRNQALGVALISYNGKLFWGFNADWDAVPDLHDLVTAVETEFGRLLSAAAAIPLAHVPTRRGQKPRVRPPITAVHQRGNGGPPDKRATGMNAVS